MTDPTAEPVAAGDVFAQLVREVDAGRALIAMTPLGERHRAAVDALSLARDVLTDARDLFGPCACGDVPVCPDPTPSPADDVTVVHDRIACVRFDDSEVDPC